MIGRVSLSGPSQRRSMAALGDQDGDSTVNTWDSLCFLNAYNEGC